MKMTFVTLALLAALFSCASKHKVQSSYEEFQGAYRHLVDEGYQKFEISPDGNKLLLVTENERQSFVTVLGLPSLKPISATALEKHYYVRQVNWIDNERFVVNATLLKGYLKKNDGISDLLVLITADGSKKRTLYPQEGGLSGHFSLTDANFRLFYNSYKDDHLMAQMRTGLSGELATQLVKINVQTKKMTTLETMKGLAGDFYLDKDLKARLFIQSNYDNTANFLLRDPSSGRWIKAPKKNAPSSLARVIRIVGDKVLAFDYAQNSKQNIFSYTFGPNGFKKRERLMPLKETDISAFGFDYKNFDLIYADTGLGRPARHYFKTSRYAALQREIDSLFPKKKVHFETRAKERFIFKVESDDTPRSYYFFDAKSAQIREIVKTNPALNDEFKHPTKLMHFQADDGLKYYGYLTTPKDKKGPFPLVVDVHGGPFGVYESWGYQYGPQLLASHGFAVLRVNYRGSAYLGDDFYRRGRGEIGKKMQTDLLTAVKAVNRSGIAKKGDACLWGGSYGAYASVMALSLFPDYFKCAAAFGGLYDLTTFTQEGDIKLNKYARHFWKEFLPQTKADLVAASPYFRASQIKGRVLLMHGEEDRRCDISQSRRLSAKLREANIPHKFISYPTTGHWFTDKTKLKSMYHTLISFLHQ